MIDCTESRLSGRSRPLLPKEHHLLSVRVTHSTALTCACKGARWEHIRLPSGTPMTGWIWKRETERGGCGGRGLWKRDRWGTESTISFIFTEKEFCLHPNKQLRFFFFFLNVIFFSAVFWSCFLPHAALSSFVSTRTISKKNANRKRYWGKTALIQVTLYYMKAKWSRYSAL